MYAFIRGKLNESSPTEAVLDVSGIGFLVQISLGTFAKLPPLGKEVTLYTAFIVREDFQGLYGFLSKEDKQLFLELLTVSGVGPKLAMSLIGHLPSEELEKSIERQDLKRLTSVPGIGKKIAERLLLEMRGRISKHTSSSSSPSCELTGALLALGYSLQEAMRLAALSKEKAVEKESLSDQIKRALKLGAKEYTLKN